MAVDPLQIALDILKDNWDEGNTDSKTPNFIKVTDQKRLDFGVNKDYILAHRSRPLQEPAGVGTASKHVTEQLDIDVRSIGPGSEPHWLNVVAEVERILDSKIKLLTDDFDILDSDGPRQDLSNKTFNLFN